MKIIICDDDLPFARELQKKVESLCKKHRIPHTIEVFDSSDNLMNSIENPENSLFLLDIEMPGLTGFELADRLGRGDRPVYIGFISNNRNFVYRAFYYRPYFFMPKELVDEELEENLLHLSSVMGSRKVQIPLLVDGQIVSLNLDRVKYVESRGNYQHIHKDSQVLKVRLPLSEMEKDWAEYGFIRTHSAFLINLSYVEEYRVNNIMMSGGVLVPISRSRSLHVKNAIMEAMIDE